MRLYQVNYSFMSFQLVRKLVNYLGAIIMRAVLFVERDLTYNSVVSGL